MMSTLISWGSTERTNCITTKEREDMEVGMSSQNTLHMNSGVGDKSYAHNSFFQKKAIIKAKPILEESITRLYYNILPKCLKVADLGCSSGPNTLEVIYNIINIVYNTSSNLNLSSPDFQFYLNDLFESDFNTIFKSLPQFYKTLEGKKGNKIGPCFINATPGTFYKRLFPTSSMHFFHCSYSLHWLSQSPEELTIDGGGTVERDGIYLTSTSPIGMQKAYLGQFQRNLKAFLKSRSEELVTGGEMVLTFIGRQNNTSEIRATWNLLGLALNEMLLENLIEKETLKSFNIPNYDPSIEEVKEIIEEEGSFILHKVETIWMGWHGNMMNNEEGANGNKLDENMTGEFIAKYIRAVTEPLLKAHFGQRIMDELFLRFKDKAAQLLREIQILEFPNFIVSLIKNA
ncbi:7-methylxanthosine synthase 1 [Arachis ipaensis]|uniref:7-methylxanthosine synthase 1 n=1 Tax=Arachis ipaensis TaxID=130454 RepID=UPI0007AF832D|nr:7-methylxanthosine synthase 1 [Arachis ipaensis]